KQDERVDGRDEKVQLTRGHFKIVAVFEAIHSVTAEQGAENQQFGRQEHPHPERLGLALLVDVIEVMGENAVFRGWMVHDRRVSGHDPPPLQCRSIRKAPASPRASRRNSTSAAATEFATPGRSLPTDSAPLSWRCPATKAGKRAAARSRLPGSTPRPWT